MTASPSQPQTPPATDPRRLEMLRHVETVVVKVGTRVLTGSDARLDLRRIDCLSEQLCRIADSGRHTIMVSSGAVGAGVGKLGLPSRPAGPRSIAGRRRYRSDGSDSSL